MQRRDSESTREADARPFVLLADAERVRLLAECLAALAAWQRELILVHYVDGVSLTSIAATAGVPVQRVSQWHRRVLAGLRGELAARRITSSSQI